MNKREMRAGKDGAGGFHETRGERNGWPIGLLEERERESSVGGK